MPNAQVRDDATDDELLACARDGDEEALDAVLLRYGGLARSKARAYYLVGGDHEDLVQEAMIGLYEAVNEFDPGLGTSFRSFAELCVTRQVVDAVRTATRHKHGPLNNYVSLHRPVGLEDDGEQTLGDLLPAPPHFDPAVQVVYAAQVRDLQRHVDDVLSDLEAEVLRLHVDGRSYQEIARTLRRHTKAVDNALQRIKRKITSHVARWQAEVA